MTDTIERTGPDALRPLEGHVCVGYKYRLPKIYGDKFVWGKSIPDGAIKVHAYFRGFVLGLAEFGSFGRRLYDLDGYPYESEAEAIRSDWQTVGKGLWSVINEFAAKLERAHDYS